ncbi:hemerythrin domain-containing protein [Sphingosinicella sp. CPCC 101087]|uniref:hemerythrin domain-containing protein n=1 Tax=Sphingosinicella sp. CPCC 101087 TaxID=2497754 RepID=UPI0013ECCDBA|nr:hemerythrin domain-containing protein [Sphingosinicella sp. CPCC 101087]
MDQVDYLYGEHRHLERLARRLEAIADLPDAPEPFGFLQLRRAFREAVMNHLKREAWAIYPLRGFVSSEICAALAELQAEGGTFSDRLAEHERRWTAIAIEAHWRAYCEELAALIASLRQRIAFEERILYPLLEQDGEGSADKLAGATMATLGSGLMMDHAEPGREPPSDPPLAILAAKRNDLPHGSATVEALSFTSAGGRRKGARQDSGVRSQAAMFRGYGHAVRGTAYRLAPDDLRNADEPRSGDRDEGRADTKLTDPDLL